MSCSSLLTKLEFALKTQHCPLAAAGAFHSNSLLHTNISMVSRATTAFTLRSLRQRHIRAVLFDLAIAPFDPTLLWANDIPNERALEVATGLFHDSALSHPRSDTTQSGCCLGDNAAGASAHIQWPPESGVVRVSALLEPSGHATQHISIA